MRQLKPANLMARGRSAAGLGRSVRTWKRSVRAEGGPDKQEKATQTVLEQAEVLTEVWVSEAPSEERRR